MVTNIKNRRHTKARLPFILLFCFLSVCACTKSVIVVQETVPPPIATPTPQITLNPENPVALYFKRFENAYSNAFSALSKAVESDLSYLNGKMDIITCFNRIQSVFFASTSINAFINDGLWEGQLFGVSQGNGQVTGSPENAVFNISLNDGSRVTGKLINNRLAGMIEVFMPVTTLTSGEENTENSGEYVSLSTSEILYNGVGWYASYNQDNKYSLLYIENQDIYFAKEQQSHIVYPEASYIWADWGLVNGKFMDYTAQRQTENDLKGENSQ